jgi:hypothetical protein
VLKEIVGTEPWRSAAQTLLDESGITVRRWRSNMSGVALHGGSAIEAPTPRTAKSFAVLAHEVGHQTLHKNNGSYPRWREEIEAWDFALGCFKRFNLRGSRKLLPWVERSIAYSVGKAERRVADPGQLYAELRRNYPRWAKRIL